jgi:linoleoyl-CoA desaturase
VSNEQRWHPAYLLQPISAFVLALAFQWGVGLHDLRVDEVLTGEQSLGELRRRARPFLKKAGWQIGKDYLFFPALALWNAPRVLAGNFLANLGRNLWSFAIIFCGHFPSGARVYTVEETANETRGEWYVRQLNGSANLEGGRLFQILTGHLSHQIEHHLFPDLPGARYPEIAPKVKAICAKYGQAYNAGSFWQQFGSVVGQIFRYALPRAPLPSVA